MGREEFGAGYSVNRLTVILASIVGFVWVVCAFLVILIFLQDAGGTEAYRDKTTMLIQEFYNTIDSEEACVAVPIIYENSVPNEQSVLLNQECIAAHQDFKAMYPDASAVYVIKVQRKYEAQYGVGEYDIHVKIGAVDKNGNDIEGLSEIIIPFERRENPYTVGVSYNMEGEIVLPFLPRYDLISYREFDGSDEVWQ